jgi:hypothetical protein
MEKNPLRAPQISAASLDFYLLRGRHERARALAEMIRSVFSSPGRDTARAHGLAVRESGGVRLRKQRARAA